MDLCFTFFMRLSEVAGRNSSGGKGGSLLRAGYSSGLGVNGLIARTKTRAASVHDFDYLEAQRQGVQSLAGELGIKVLGDFNRFLGEEVNPSLPEGIEVLPSYAKAIVYDADRGHYNITFRVGQVVALQEMLDMEQKSLSARSDAGYIITRMCHAYAKRTREIFTIDTIGVSSPAKRD